MRMDGPLTVSEFNRRVETLVTSSDMITNVEVTGEISAPKLSPSGHMYLSLKDSKNVLKCIIYRFTLAKIKVDIENGLQVTAYGSASYYAPSGDFRLKIDNLEIAGKGEQQIALEKLKAKLLDEGLFDQQRKRPIPEYPSVIGIVTSPTGSAVKDIIDNAGRRFPADILLSPTLVQGADAPKSIVHAIKLLEIQDIDVMIVGRGGGSSEDLSAFNDESVVRAIAECKVPVISAVGHSTDTSLSDRVADGWADTPTAAAMLATPDRIELYKNMRDLWSRLDTSLKMVNQKMRARFDVLDHRLAPRNAKAAVDVYNGKLKNASVRMDSSIERMINGMRGRFTFVDAKLDPKRMMDKVSQSFIGLDDLSNRMDISVRRSIELDRGKLEGISMKMEGLNPSNVLSRGYSFIRDGDGKVVTSVKDLFPGTDVTIAMRDGSALAKIKELRIDE